MKICQRILIGLLLVGLSVGAASAQFGFGIVYDPTNYANALLRYAELEQQLVQLKNSYAQLVTQYNLALRMSRNIQNMPARYEAPFSQWRNAAALDTYGNTGGWVTGINWGVPQQASVGYQQATTELVPYSSAELSGMTAEEMARVKSQYATIELADGASTTAIGTIGAIRGNASSIQTRIANLEQDSLSSDPDLNSEVAVLNKINAAGVLTLRTLQDSNKLLASLLEEQTILAKQQREATANSVNTEIARQASVAANLGLVTGTITDSLQNFRMP
jgi:hypothetical protein